MMKLIAEKNKLYKLHSIDNHPIWQKMVPFEYNHVVFRLANKEIFLSLTDSELWINPATKFKFEYQVIKILSKGKIGYLFLSNYREFYAPLEPLE